MLLFCKVIALLPFLTDGQPLEESRRTVRENSGEEAVLPCHLSEAVCDWLKDGWLLDMGGRYKTRENCHLVISPVLPLDQGQFQCQVGGERAARSPVVNLSVNTEPGQPHIKEGDVGEGESLRLSCDRGRGEESCDWYINNDQLEGEHQQQLLLTNFIPNFHGVVIGCEVQGRLIKRFKLNLIADRGTTQKAIVTTEPLEGKRARGKMKSLYTCTFAEDEDDNETIPPYIELKGNKQKMQIAEDELKRKFKCRRFSKNKNNFYQIRNILKSSGSKIRQIYKKFNQML